MMKRSNGRNLVEESVVYSRKHCTFLFPNISTNHQPTAQPTINQSKCQQNVLCSSIEVKKDIRQRE